MKVSVTVESLDRNDEAVPEEITIGEWPLLPRVGEYLNWTDDEGEEHERVVIRVRWEQVHLEGRHDWWPTLLVSGHWREDH